MQVSSDAHENSAQTVRQRSRVTPVRVVILVLMTILAGLLLSHAGELTRRIRFYFVGRVEIDGLTFFLNPADKTITQAILHADTWEPETTATIRDILKPGDTFIDVGANIGWFTLIASREVGEEGRVIAFEPDPESFDILRRNVTVNKCPNVILEKDALSNKRGTIWLYIHDKNKGGHSLLKSDERSQRVEVQALTLDEYLQGFERKIALVKMDTEGAEGLILEGMQSTIQTQDRMDIVMEFAPNALRPLGTDPEAMLYRLLESNYRAYAIDHPSGQLVPVDKNQIPRLIEILDKSGKYVNLLLSRGANKNPPIRTEN